MDKPKINIKLIDKTWSCWDGCCTNFDTVVIVNGVELDSESQDTSSIVEAILEHLGYDVEIEEKYEHN